MENHYKVVVVGGGVAGLYAAWRLCVDAADITGLTRDDVLVIEGSNRLSGRLFTQDLSAFAPSLPSGSGLRAELGGMRFLDKHIFVGYLAKKLGLPYVPFEADMPKNPHYLRGQPIPCFTEQTVYTLQASEQGQTPGAILSTALLNSVVDASWLPTDSGSVTLRDFVDSVLSASYQQTPLTQLGFWNLVVGNGQYQGGSTNSPANISNEAYEFFADAGAYDTVPSNWNAAAATVAIMSDFASSSNPPCYYALTDGYEALSNALAQCVTVQSGTPISTVQKNVLGIYTLTAADGTTVTANNVILALPPRALQLIAPLSIPLYRMKRQLQQASRVPLFKIFLVYQQSGSTPWWSDVVDDTNWPQYTRMTTDMPMRQIYNFGSYTASGTTYSLLQASYSDALKAGYWAGLMSQGDGGSVSSDIFADLSVVSGTENLGSGMLQWNQESGATMPLIFETVHNQFVTLLSTINGSGSDFSPQPPIAGMAIDWATDPFGGGVNYWNVGVDVASAYDNLLNPLPMDTAGTGGLFIVGEGYSLLQGWVEGALWTVEDALAKGYQGWSRPSWIPSSNAPVPQPED